MITAKQLAAWATSKVPTNEALAGITPESRLENAIEARDAEHRAELANLAADNDAMSRRFMTKCAGFDAQLVELERLKGELAECEAALQLGREGIQAYCDSENAMRDKLAEAEKRAEALESLVDTERQVRKKTENTLFFVRKELAEAKRLLETAPIGAAHDHYSTIIWRKKNTDFLAAPSPAESPTFEELVERVGPLPTTGLASSESTWQSIRKSAAEVAQWPAWKREGAGILQELAKPAESTPVLDAEDTASILDRIRNPRPPTDALMAAMARTPADPAESTPVHEYVSSRTGACMECGKAIGERPPHPPKPSPPDDIRERTERLEKRMDEYAAALEAREERGKHGS